MTKTNDIKLKTEQCFCKSYCDDDGIIQDCTCGKCELNDVKLENNCPSCGSNEHSYCGKPAKMWTPVNMNLPKEELIKQVYAKGLKDGREKGYIEGVKMLEWRINCDTLISELSGWKGCVDMAVEESLGKYKKQLEQREHLSPNQTTKE